MINPREVADKSITGNLSKSIKMSLEIESESVRKNTQTFNSNRYSAVSAIDDYQELKDKAREIKEHSIENLPELLKQLEESVKTNGGKFYLAKNAEAACGYIKRVCQSHKAKLVVKGKSITSEEIKLNSELESAGIQVAETDLAEFILQYSDEQPSHIVAPAIHQSRERISKLFMEKFNPPKPLITGEELTRFARNKLRDKFLNADIGITGANLIAADTGTIALVESEGNIRLTYSLPPVHIALTGIEKVIPSTEDLPVFIELLAASGTGQALTSYTSFIRPPLNLPVLKDNKKLKDKREFHLVLIDNGRTAMREDDELRQALYCIRCSACLNSCANFQAVGGHAFGGETYTGGIGGAWEAGTGTIEKAGFAELCTGCSRCIPQCPVRIDIPGLNETIKQRLTNKNKLSKEKIQKQILSNFTIFAKFGHRLNRLNKFVNNSRTVRLLLKKFVGIDRNRKLPESAPITFAKMYKKQKRDINADSTIKVVIFPDVYTNLYFPERGIAFVNILNRLGVEVSLSKSIPAGRASLSQGLIKQAAKRAEHVTDHLMGYIDNGYSIITCEPSVLALFRQDYKNLLKDKEKFFNLHLHSYDPIEFIYLVLKQQNKKPSDIFNAEKLYGKNQVFYHGHCQLKTIDAQRPTIQILEETGIDVITSEVECCGMAGSFGYKKDFYDISIRIGEDLFRQIKEADKQGERTLLASGVSCRDQIFEGMNRGVIHPVQLLEMMMTEV